MQQIDRFDLVFQHVTPVSPVVEILPERMLDQAGMVTFRHPQDRYRLNGTLIDPSGWQLGFAGNADLYTGGIGEINDMRPHAM